MQTDKMKALHEAMKLYEDVMVESLAQIRQAENILERSMKDYKRAMEKKSYLQDQIIEENDKIIKDLEEKIQS